MEVSPDAELNRQSTINYKSFDLSQVNDGSKPDVSKVSKNIPLHQAASGWPQFHDQDDINSNKAKISSSDKTLVHFYIASITCAIGVTAALMLQVHLSETLLFVEGVLVSDHERCTALGQRVLQDRGSSVDAAISATLCLGVVHPHVLGIGGGGVMLVHDIRKNETIVIHFQGAAPKMLTEEMLLNGFEQRSDCRVKAGLLVGVPGMLRGLYKAHRMYGSLPWNNLVTRAANVAKEGFNVSKSLSDAILEVKGEQLMARFKNLFFPNGRALPPDSFLRMPNLAQVLHNDLSNFFSGNLSQEMEEEVQGQGGVLSSDDISNYTVEVGQSLEGLYKKFRICVPAPPSAGAALLLTLKLLVGFQLHENNTSENHKTALGWTSEALMAAVTMASGLGGPKYNSSVTEWLADILSTLGSPPEDHTFQKAELTVGQVAVMGADDLIVSVAGSLSRPFGSRIVTRSGIILNSLILDFSWPNKTRGQLKTNRRNRIQPCKRPVSALIPTIVVPAWHKCGTYMVLVVSGGYSLTSITQVLLRSLVYENDILLMGSDGQSQFPEESAQLVNATGHRVERLKTFVHGVLRNKDLIKKWTLPVFLKSSLIFS